jgi:small-conductance mechanosensitive channel
MMARSAVRAAVAAFAFLIWVGIGAAQDTAPDYAAWQTVAERAEEAVENAEASNPVLETLRAEIVEWRQEFQGQLNSNDSRIATLQEQVEALGPAPEEGETEAEEIANRRAELNAQIERLTTPRRIAEEAFSRTNGIISEIDQIIRDRQANALLDAGPWPINPAHWADAIRQLRHSALAAVAGAQQSWGTPSRREQARDNLPLVLFLVTLGAILLARARRWSEWLAQRLLRDDNRATAQIADFVVSLGQIVLPMLGLWAIVRGAGATGLFAARGQSLLDTLEAVGFVLFFTLWLVGRVFPRDDVHRSGPGGLTPRRRAEARLYVLAMGGMLAFYVLLLELSQFDRYSRATDAVLHYPLTLVASLLLMRMGWIMRQARRNIGEEDIAADRDLYLRFVVWLGQVLIVVGVVAPALATFGYGNAAEYLIYPTIVTLYLFGTVRLLQVLVYDIYRAVTGKDSIDDSLIPTLSSFVLVLAALLVLPLIWGARVTDMSEMWTSVRGGLTVGGITISPASFFTLIIVFGLGYAITRATQNALKVAVLPKTRIDPGGQVAIVSGLGYVGIFLAGLVAITSAGMDLSNLAIVAGALSVGIGFGLQTIVSNFVSGIILLIERPISEGDWIEVGGQMGYVRSISVRSTRIETFDRTDVIVPNADLISGTVTNFTRGNTVGRVIIPVGVAYGTDTRRVEAILREIAEEHPMALMNPPPAIVFAGFGADSLDFEIRMILRDVNWMLVVKSEVNHQIAARFTEEGIEIPFAQRDVWLRNPEALQPDTKSTPSEPVAQEPPAATPVPEIDPDVDADGDGEGR